MNKEETLAFLQSCIDNIDAKTCKEIEEIIFELTEDCNAYINLAELTKRFVNIDEVFNHEHWNLLQILANFNLMIPIKINDWIPVSSGILPDESFEELEWDCCTGSDNRVGCHVLATVKNHTYSSSEQKWVPGVVETIYFKETGFDEIDEVVAWMPLPIIKPYEEEA